MPLLFFVPQSHCVVVERFGKFSRICYQGPNFGIPFIESIRKLPTWQSQAVKQDYLIELTEQCTDTPSRSCHTKDNVEVTTNASVYWRIVEPVRALYEVDVLPRAVA